LILVLDVFFLIMFGIPICFSGYYFHNFWGTKQLIVFQGVTGVYQIKIYAILASKCKMWSHSTWLCPYAMLHVSLSLTFSHLLHCHYYICSQKYHYINSLAASHTAPPHHSHTSSY
jgi:hypothetical protein